MCKIVTTETFIEKAKLIHEDSYDYSLVKYKKAIESVTIICKKHDKFKQTPHSHLQGHGCPKCGGGVKHTVNYFIEKAKTIHGEKYSYDLVEYVDDKTHVMIICPTHGIFEQTPNSHLSGTNCPKCHHDKCRTKLCDFIQKSHNIHNNKYDYSKVVFNSIIDKIEIVCPIHGLFIQTVTSHLNGSGCALCGFDSIRLGIDVFIKRANEKHNNRYDYSLVDYKNNYTQIKIICPTHGIFEQTPNIHLNNSGCVFCREERRKKSEFKKYSQMVNRITRINKITLFNNWDGLDYYDGEDIKNNLNLNPNEKNYPTIDHKISKRFGFLNNISINVVGGLDNICITKRSNNSKKRTKNYNDFIKQLQQL